MKKTVKLLCLAAALTVGTGSAAQAEGFKIGADVVSSYIWRGYEVDNAVNVQPALSYTFPGIGIVVGFWGSYGVIENEGEDRYKEIDTYLTIPIGNASLTVTNYYNPNAGDTFDFDEFGPNTVELSLGYSYKNLSLLGAIFVAGNDYDNAKYFEAGYKCYDKDGYSAKAFVGAGNEGYYGDGGEAGENNIAVVNTGLTVSKERFSVSYIYNPDQEASHLVFMASF
ncbi:MAG: hypothetical protein HGA62_00225 [Chlorobiaceae bacterium]|nr:hypothetical protein [Chlorobiaceae bacterium]NTV61417.1 hypothetical protein [Chlorobiaceae bacterium]